MIELSYELLSIIILAFVILVVVAIVISGVVSTIKYAEIIELYKKKEKTYKLTIKNWENAYNHQKQQLDDLERELDAADFVIEKYKSGGLK